MVVVILKGSGHAKYFWLQFHEGDFLDAWMHGNRPQGHPASEPNNQNLFWIPVEQHGQVTESEHDLLIFQICRSLGPAIGYKILVSSFHLNRTYHGFNPLPVIEDIRIFQGISNFFGGIEGFQVVAPENGEVFRLPDSQTIVAKGQKKEGS